MLLCTCKCVCETDKVFRVRIPRLQGMSVFNFCQNYTCANVKNFTFLQSLFKNNEKKQSSPQSLSPQSVFSEAITLNYFICCHISKQLPCITSSFFSILGIIYALPVRKEDFTLFHPLPPPSYSSTLLMQLYLSFRQTNFQSLHYYADKSFLQLSQPVNYDDFS